jgi:carbamoylphosphate synthase large subunit
MNIEEYKNVLIGKNVFNIEWEISLNKIDKKNIIISSFTDLDNLKNIILNKNIIYILPMSNIDNNLIQNINLELYDNIRIIYPKKESIELLHNKNLFTEFMLNNYIEYIPEIYYLNNIKIKDIEYPAIYKPTYSTNGSNMIIIYNESDFLSLQNHNNIQKFIEDEYEYSAYMLCIDGIIINWKIIRSKYIKYNIKKQNFQNNYENIENFNIVPFKNIINKLNYSGGICIDFKFNECTNKLYIFEINPRFGGSAFTYDFIYELLCIK